MNYDWPDKEIYPYRPPVTGNQRGWVEHFARTKASAENRGDLDWYYGDVHCGPNDVVPIMNAVGHEGWSLVTIAYQPNGLVHVVARNRVGGR